MLESIKKSIDNRYHTETQSNLLKIIGLHIFIILGLVTGLILFVLDMMGFSTDECLPGDISIVIIFGLAL